MQETLTVEMSTVVASFISNNLASDEFFHDFIAATVDRLNARVNVRSCNRIFHHVAPATVQLHTLICYSVLEITYPEENERTQLATTSTFMSLDIFHAGTQQIAQTKVLYFQICCAENCLYSH